jgi:pimeloyl-ACP methyl ester carboxylesterase
MAGREPRALRFTGPDGPARLLIWPALGRPVTTSPPGAVLLACHGWTDSADVFQPLADTLHPRHPIVALDAPAHGGTPLGPGDYAVADHARTSVAVLDALPHLLQLPASDRLRVVSYGHSLGALTATRVTLERPRAVRALVLEEPARTTLRRPAAVASMRAWLLGLRQGDHASRVAWARVNHPDWPRAELDPWAAAKAAVDLAEFDRRHDWGEPLPVLLSEVQRPTLLIRGEPALGGIVSVRAAARCQATCPGGVEVLTLDAGHSPRRESPGRFVAALSEVLANASGR